MARVPKFRGIGRELGNSVGGQSGGAGEGIGPFEGWGNVRYNTPPHPRARVAKLADALA